MTKRIIFLVTAMVSILLLQNCAAVPSDTDVAVEDSNCSSQTPRSQEQSANFPKVSFAYDPKFFSSVTREEILEDLPLQSSDDKPGENFPKHVVFHLTYGEQDATIRILPVSEYRRMYAVSKDLTRSFEKSLDGVYRASANTNFRLDKQMPFIPFYDASQEFQDKVKRISFQNGSGFFFLTEYTIEPTIMTNDDLRFFYQGISNGGNYYVLAEFPVDAPFLPKDSSTTSSEDKILLKKFYSGESGGREYEKYISAIAKRLEKLPDNRFQPNLKKFEEIITSLKIEN